MTNPQFTRSAATIISTLGIILILTGIVRSQTPSNSCSSSALTRFIKHTAVSGETVSGIAKKYNLLPATVIAMNPRLRTGISSGQEILIPPYDGIVVEVGRGQTWGNLAKRYNVRADVLFELNGCQKPADIAFIPTAKMTSNRDRNRFTTPVATNSTSVRFTQYPLATTKSAATIALDYGWQTNPRDGQAFFHSGIDLLANVGTPVQTVADGVVAYAQTQGSYGQLVIINHSDGVQTRYAHLESINVNLGQQVKAGDQIGSVGITGQPASKQPHLHFEVRIKSDLGWAAKEPKDYFR